MDRRTFIRSGASILAGSWIWGRMAHAWPPVNPAMLGAAPETSTAAKYSWAAWNEVSESGLSSADTFICMMEGTGDETGEGGGITGTDLILSQTGSVAASTGTPPYRLLDGLNDGFQPTSALIYNIVNLRDTFTLIIKLADVTDNTQSIFKARRSASPAYGWDLYGNASGSLAVQCSPLGDGASYTLDTATASSMPTTGTLYVACWKDSNYWRAGFSTTRPTKWSDFGANNRVTNTDSTQWNTDFNGGKSIGYGDYGYLAGKLYYIVLSKLCLINNAA